MLARSGHTSAFLFIAWCTCAMFFFVPASTHAAEVCDSNGNLIEDTPPQRTIQSAAPQCAGVAAGGSPIAASPGLSEGGIFGCLGQGARVVAANVGTTRAIGGVYVPVNDAAVTLNTGFLVYKECILDGMARRIALSGTSEFNKQMVAAYQEGPDGTAGYVRDMKKELETRISEIYAHELSDASLSSMCAAFRQPVRTAILRGRLQEVNSPRSMYACPFTGSQNFYDNWFAMTGPTGNPFSVAAVTVNNIGQRSTEYEGNWRQMLDWGRGTYSVVDNNADPLARRILTPGAFIADSISQALGSGYRQLENANEIDQIVTNLFAGLTTRIVGSPSGIPGLFVSTGNRPAYIDQMVAQTQAAVRGGAVNAATITLSNYRQAEAAYLDAKQGTGNALLNIIVQLRSVENQCWNLIIPAVQTHAQSNGNPTLIIATSTQFSQAVIDNPVNNIRSLASTTAAEISASQQTLIQIDQLIAQVSNTTSPAAQQQALLQIDQMIAQGRLHTQQDAQAASDQRNSVSSALTTLLNNTNTTWADSQDPNIGWCNVNNTAVVERWFNAWRQ